MSQGRGKSPSSRWVVERVACVDVLMRSSHRRSSSEQHVPASELEFGQGINPQLLHHIPPIAENPVDLTNIMPTGTRPLSSSSLDSRPSTLSSGGSGGMARSDSQLPLIRALFVPHLGKLWRRSLVFCPHGSSVLTRIVCRRKNLALFVLRDTSL